MNLDHDIEQQDMDPPVLTVSGLVAAAPPQYGSHAILVLLDGQPLPRKFKAGEVVQVTTGQS